MFQPHNVFVLFIHLRTKGDKDLTDHTVCVYSMEILNLIQVNFSIQASIFTTKIKFKKCI